MTKREMAEFLAGIGTFGGSVKKLMALPKAELVRMTDIATTPKAQQTPALYQEAGERAYAEAKPRTKKALTGVQKLYAVRGRR